MTKDRSEKTNTFNDEGRLMQTEYAIKNVSEAGTIMGIVCTDGVVLAGVNQAKSETKEKIYKLTKHTFCALAGLFGDANRLVHFARAKAIGLQSFLGTTLTAKDLCRELGIKMQVYTQNGGARPFGVSMLISGQEDGKNVLFSLDPSGTINSWKAQAIGQTENEINAALKAELDGKGDFNTIEGTKILLKAFAKSQECTAEIAEKMEILHVKKNKNNFLKIEDIKSMFQRINLKMSI